MSETGRYIDERLEASITSSTRPENPVDQFAPLSFIEWLKYNNFLYTNTEDFLIRYQSYLNNWFQATNTSQTDSQEIIRKYYANLINEIVLNYSSVDERRYLKNLNFNNSRDMTLAIPFFAKKIKDICLYFSTLRDTAQTANVQYNLKGSNFGIGTTLYNLFISLLGNDDLTENVRTLNLSVSSIRNNTTIEVEDIYDTCSDYFDINPLAPASAFNAFSGMRAEYFELNQTEIDPDLYLNINYSILRAIFQYPFYLVELGENLQITPAVTSEDLDYLKDSDFTDLVAVSSIEALALNIKAQEITKFIGADFYYVLTDSTGTAYLTGLLFEADSEFANVLNKRFPTVNAVPSEEFLKTGKELGLFFKPDKQGLLNFTNFKFTPKLNERNLKPSTVYYFPDPQKYGNISSNTRLTFDSPLEFIEDNTHNKIDFANSFQFGDPSTDPYLPTFRAYQSREQTTNFSNFGISRYVDAQDFFTGDKKTVWANKDVFQLIPSNTLPIDERAKRLLPINKTLVQYKTDVYGNEYGIYKEIEPVKFIQSLAQGPGNIKQCLIIDGYAYRDAISAYNFDYTIVDPEKGYSGVILKTITNPNLFNLSGIDPYTINSYLFQPEIYCSNVVENNFICNIVDAFTFTLPNNKLLPDFSTDSPAYDPADSSLYYVGLYECGVNRDAPGFRPTFAYPGSFTFTPPPSVTTTIDCFFFTVNGKDPCEALVLPEPFYVEDSNFANIHIPGRNTIINTTLTGIAPRQTIYNTKYREYGEVYVRNSNSEYILPLSAALSAVFIKYNAAVRDEIFTKLTNLDVYYDTIQFETDNYIAFERIDFDYETNTVIGGNAGINTLYQGTHQQFEKFSTVWFNEADRNLLVCQTVLYPELSSTNYKIIYPKIYTYNINTQSLIQLFPLKQDDKLTFNDLKDFSLSGRDIELNIVEIDKPIITLNDENNLYKITYIGRDIANSFYIFSILFKYIDGVLSIDSSTMYKLGSDVYNQNFANPTIGSVLETYTILGSSIGTLDMFNKTFNWGVACNVDPLLTIDESFLMTIDNNYIFAL